MLFNYHEGQKRPIELAPEPGMAGDKTVMDAYNALHALRCGQLAVEASDANDIEKFETAAQATAAYGLRVGLDPAPPIRRDLGEAVAFLDELDHIAKLNLQQAGKILTSPTGEMTDMIEAGARVGQLISTAWYASTLRAGIEPLLGEVIERVGEQMAEDITSRLSIEFPDADPLN
jgi:hypothetical protein